MGDFISRNKQEWDELESLVKRARKSIRKLSPQELSRLDVLYRRATVHLSQVRTRTSDEQLTRYLNGLTAAAHSLIYLPPKNSMFRGMGMFLREGFARSIARGWKFHLTSTLLLISGGLIAYFVGAKNPVALYALLPAGDPRVPGAPREFLLEILRSGRDSGGGFKFAFASFLFQHNLKVGLASMALGILAAVPTVLLIIYNGMILGAFVAVHHQAGIYSEMWAWILPHGVTEIGAIVLCGGVGLQLGWAIMCPGLRTRNEALQATASEVGRTVVGAGIMLIFAAIIESYLRQSEMSTVGRLLFAAGTAVFWAIYIWHGLHLEKRESAADVGHTANL